MIYRFRQVTPSLFRGSAPDPIDILELKKRFGIKKIVSLDATTGHRISKTAKKLGINQIIIPIDWRRATLMNLFRFNLKKLLLEGGPTYVHCAAGKDRTGLVVALVQCKYLGKDPETAIKEAEKIGLGQGIDPNVKHLYEKLIRSCKPAQDINNADIVSQEREYIADNRDSYLDEGRQCSFSPYLSQTKQYPADSVYNYINEQSPTRENYSQYKYPIVNEKDDDNVVPLVGLYNTDVGSHGAGPVEPNPGGFIYD